ncbi:UNVERIFIED_CONTAM: hypothetical protein HDU68_006916 [Siphonaria sp. JEL0065]|nr:hypothetical protein HDU68_006916 [Siphonaria sp. JEL0065]
MPPRTTRNTSKRKRKAENSEGEEEQVQNPAKAGKTAVPTVPADTVPDTGPAYWLMKAEPETRIEKGKDVKFSIRDLKAIGTSQWDGVRNYEARNNMRRMKVDDIVLFYHSNCKVPGIAGLAKVVKESYPDHTAWDSEHPYFDAKTKKDDPKWFMVDVEYMAEFDRLIPLKELQGYSDLKEMHLVKRGRLSVQPVTSHEFEFIRALASLKDE